MTTRELLTLMAVIGLISLLFFFWISHLAHGAEAPRGSDEHVRGIIQHALDDAFENQVEILFAGWMRDPTGQPGRAAAGVRKAVAAYRHAIVAIDTNGLALEPIPLPRPREARR
jgi:hypothetical protein